MVFVSIGLRMKVEVEALNNVEPLGAYTRHRTVPLIKRVQRDGGIRYRIVTVPAISGQSINNGYSRTLVDLAIVLGLPVCDECRDYPKRSGFSKRSKTNDDFDKRIQTCVVDDLTGFLAPNINVRKTSPVMFSNMVPDIEYAKAALDSQFHVRYDFVTREHHPFNIEAGSAVYMLSIAVNVDDIGRLSNGTYVNDVDKRIELAFKGLIALFEGLNFGAKKARYLPLYEVLGGVAAVSHPIPFMVSKPMLYYNNKSYVEDTVARAERFVNALKFYSSDNSSDKSIESITVVYFDNEGVLKTDVSSETVEVRRADSFTELVGEVLKAVKNLRGPSKSEQTKMQSK
ncbi:MAG: DevR family CRISPR-associated autoregulator [Desulfurococcaceae archaeon]